MPPPRSALQTPSRRQTLAMVPSGQKSRPTGVGVDVDNMTIGHAGGLPKPAPRRGRASMIPRVGRENSVSATPNKGGGGRKMAGSLGAATPSVSKSTEASRRRSVVRLDRRQSVGGDRRQTLGGGDRRQSLLPPPPVTQAKVDPRQIQDKSFQQAAIKKILKFLEGRGYPYPISAKGLARPSAKDFTNLVTFLLRIVDPQFQKGDLKIEDEVFLNFKSMGYPFNISKTSIVAAGATNTWPSLLAALSWLVTHLQCIEQETPTNDLYTDAPFESIDDLDLRTDKAFYHFFLQAYEAYLLGDEVMQNEVEVAFHTRFEMDDAQLQLEIERVSDLNGAIVEQMQALKDEVQP